ncbi:MAG: hypothetical protein IJW67_12140 [Blautia sp.]|nr:hypothetical protein [Blautia sp.]
MKRKNALHTQEKAQYLNLCRPSELILAAALLIMLAGIVIWGFTGEIPQVIRTRGSWHEEEGLFYCAFRPDKLEGVREGSKANVRFANGSALICHVAEISPEPVSYEEAAAELSSVWRLQTLWSDSETVYKYVLKLSPETKAASSGGWKDGTIVSAAVIVDEVKPITYIFN